MLFNFYQIRNQIIFKSKMQNFRRSVEPCNLFVSKTIFNWLLFISNLCLISASTTDFLTETQTYSDDAMSQHTTKPCESDSIEMQIKKFLNVHPSNKSLDHVIRNFFNIENPNPMYIFVLPSGEKNRTLVLTKNSFDKAVYPNISIGQRFVKDNHHSKKLFQLFNSNIDKDNPNESQADNLIYDVKDLDESESMRIVAENVRTERNFIEFMEKLNENVNLDGNGLQTKLPFRKAVDVPLHTAMTVNKEYEDVVNPKLKYKFEIDYASDLLKPTSQSSVKTTKPLDWKDLGLDGWKGGLREPGKNFDTIVTESRTTENTNIVASTHILYVKPRYSTISQPGYRATKTLERSTLPTVFTKISQQKKKHSTRNRKPKSKNNSVQDTHFEHTINHPTDVNNPVTKFNYPEATTLPTNIHSWEIDMGIPGVVTDLLKKENPRIAEIAETLSIIKPKWPITSSRADHKDDDVFIARANNPFGHSTKWLWRNSSSSHDQPTENESRSKRGALELYSMVKCATGCDPLIFKGYGCYCGFLGSGRTLDGIDRCCKMHDYCYETANCPMFIEYFVPYVWKCYRGRPLCAIDQGEWGGPGSCATRLCECDQALSKCLRRFYCPRKRAVCTSSPLRLLQNVLMEI
ncbi:Group 10 secretory phospholipase A2 [Pseudolycoriella hygida]|uniref:Group 10 secretory phospholipase A2 n=1 Tax=Pseudolycoriella hygida TaxID=35572 RepID=A0A9Q0MVL4_9DIPT|nr:Group 10 secretory phospholipase A2 [Pseudolycoriella hygida]